MGSHAVQVSVSDTHGFALGSRVDIGGISGRVTAITQASLYAGNETVAPVPLSSSLHVETAMPSPNPWTPMPLLIDQTLHVCHLALLGGIFLS